MARPDLPIRREPSTASVVEPSMARSVQAPNRQGLYDPQHERDACGVGFVVDIKGRRSFAVLQQAIQVLLNMEHRGACGCETNTGDGAGILLQTPHEFFAQQLDLPALGQYGVGMVFLPTADGDRQACQSLFES